MNNRILKSLRYFFFLSSALVGIYGFLGKETKQTEIYQGYFTYDSTQTIYGEEAKKLNLVHRERYLVFDPKPKEERGNTLATIIIKGTPKQFRLTEEDIGKPCDIRILKHNLPQIFSDAISIEKHDSLIDKP